MNTSQQHYAPWERTESDDLQILQALNQASEIQLSGLVDELLQMVDETSETRN